MRYKMIITLLALITLSQVGYGDEIKFKNGNVITGKIVQLTDGKIVIKSDVAGEITAELSNIQTISSEAPVTVNLKDGTGFTQRLIGAQNGRFSIQGNDSIRTQEFSIADIASINPPIKPAPKWHGNVTAGVTSTHGNTKTESITGSANAHKRTDDDRTTLNTDYAKSKQEDKVTGDDLTIEDWWKARAKYDYFFSPKMYGYIDTRYEKDSVALLDRRVTVGVGGGYQWVESNDMNFSTELGLASLYEKYDNQTESNSKLTMQLGYHFDKKLRKNITFINDLTYYPALQKFSDFYLTTTAEIRANFTKSFFVNCKAILDYDKTPAPGAHQTDVKYFLGLGYSF
jgi:putative salt-induced outer membrane protein YdiY